MRDEPNFVASIAGTPASPSSSPPPVEPPTIEQPITVPEAWSAAPQPPQPRPRQRRRQHQRMMSRVLLLAIVVGFAIYAAGTGGQLIGMLREGASARVVPAEGGSLLRAVAFEAALQGLPEGASVESLRVTADRLDARVVVDGNVRLVRVTAKGLVTDLPAPESPTGKTVRVDPRAPARIVRAVTRRTGRGPASISHLSLDGSRWQLVFADGAQFSADARGRDVRRG
jgi:hypothetical protein